MHNIRYFLFAVALFAGALSSSAGAATGFVQEHGLQLPTGVIELTAENMIEESMRQLNDPGLPPKLSEIYRSNLILWAAFQERKLDQRLEEINDQLPELAKHLKRWEAGVDEYAVTEEAIKFYGSAEVYREFMRPKYAEMLDEFEDLEELKSKMYTLKYGLFSTFESK